MSGVLVGVIVALVGAIFNFIVGSVQNYQRWNLEQKRIRRQWSREDRLRLERWEREDRAKFQPERIKVYRDMHKAASFHNIGLYHDPFKAKYRFERNQLIRGIEEIRLCRTEVLLLAYSNEAREAAGLIENEACVFHTKLLANYNSADEIDQTWVDNEGGLLTAAAQKFIQAVRSEQDMEDW